MQTSMVLAGMAMGVASTPHCALMCGTPCAAITAGRRGASAGFQAGRAIGYMGAGAVVAGGVSALGVWSRTAPALQPLWLMLHLAFLLLGLWWLYSGRMPQRLLRDGSAPIRVVHRRGHVFRAGFAGLAWVAWPCGALQGALLLAALADGPAGGALVMGGFALCSLPALGAAPWLWQRLQRFEGTRISADRLSSLGYRMAGLALVASSAWAMASGVRERLGALCAT
jgi:sulfite exporter TauE/SafE